MRNAFRIEDRWQRIRAARARRLGFTTIVEPYTGYGSSGWVRVLARVQMAPPPARRLRALPRRSREPSLRGWRSFTRIPVALAPATVTVDGVAHRVRADRGGVIDVRLPAKLPAGWQTIRFESSDGCVTEAPMLIVPEEQRIGLISDIDDTVMVTALPRPFLAAWNTFVLDEHARTPTPGMNVLYERFLNAQPGARPPVLYLSTGPWNVAPALARFLGRNLYPAGPLLLTDWGPTPQRLFRSGYEHKVRSLDRLAEEFPRVRWLLIGDDGQRDEEIYGSFARRHPDRVLAIAIRQLSPGQAVLAGGRAGDSDWRSNARVPWATAPDGRGLVRELCRLGVFEAPDDEAGTMEGFEIDSAERDAFFASEGRHGDLDPGPRGGHGASPEG